MNATSNTMKELLKIAGRVLFIIGLIGIVFSLLVGFWPGAGAILLMLSGAVMIAYSNSMFSDANWPGAAHVTGRVEDGARALLQQIDTEKLKRALRTIALAFAAFFLLIIVLFILGQNYFKARDTRADGKAMVEALEDYPKVNHTYPADLNTLIGKNPLRSTWQQDYWGHAYRYAATGSGFTLRSAGADGKFDTGDDVVVK